MLCNLFRLAETDSVGDQYLKQCRDRNTARIQLNNALKSVASSTSGASATLFLTLTLCLNNIVMDTKPNAMVDCLRTVC